MKKFLIFFFIVMIVAHQSSAQLVKKVIADKIVAQVGDKIILRSDVLNAISDAKRQGTEAQLPPNPECAFLEGQLIQKALVLQAEKDSLTVSDDELDAALDNQVRGFIREYGSKEVLEEIAGKTVYQIKEDFKPVFRERKLADQMRNKVLENVKITPAEVKVYFNKIPKDSLPYYETELEVSQILLIPKANKDVDDYVIKQLYDYRRQAEAGTQKFEQLAKLYSDDQGTEKQGGTLSLNRNDKSSWDPTFLSAAFKLKEGQISPVIKSKFGYHIIKMVSRAGDDAVVRHILKIPPVTDDEIKLAINKLDSIRVKLLANQLSFGEAINKYSEDENSKFNGGAIQSRDGSTYITIDQLDKDMVVAIKDLKPGEYSKPQYYIDERGRKLVRLIYLKTRTSPHRENLKDDYNKIAQRALEDKKQEKLEKWFKEHLPSYYISIDKEFEGCASLADWWKYAAKN
ncbi:chaperone SurA precursor [mine drainage metagenome]|uniref:Chaperone SurA n=1 Tax=mine drainage metagenome TaxID=410659 RepID=A0A1J5SU37_9ZZZZ